MTTFPTVPSACLPTVIAAPLLAERTRGGRVALLALALTSAGGLAGCGGAQPDAAAAAPAGDPVGAPAAPAAPTPGALPPGTLALVVHGLPANTGAVDVARVEGPNGYRETVAAGPGRPVYLGHLEAGAYAVRWEPLEAADQGGRGVFVPTPSGQTVMVGGGSGAPEPIAEVTYALGTGLVALVPEGLPPGAEPLSLGTLHGSNGWELAIRGYPGTPTVSQPLRPGAYVMEWANVVTEVNGDTLLFAPTPRGHEITLGASFVPLRVATRYQLASGVVELSARGLPPDNRGAEYVGTLSGPRGAQVDVRLGFGITKRQALSPGVWIMRWAPVTRDRGRFAPVPQAQEITVTVSPTRLPVVTTYRPVMP